MWWRASVKSAASHNKQLCALSNLIDHITCIFAGGLNQPAAAAGRLRSVNQSSHRETQQQQSPSSKATCPHHSHFDPPCNAAEADGEVTIRGQQDSKDWIDGEQMRAAAPGECGREHKGTTMMVVVAKLLEGGASSSRARACSRCSCGPWRPPTRPWPSSCRQEDSGGHTRCVVNTDGSGPDLPESAGVRPPVEPIRGAPSVCSLTHALSLSTKLGLHSINSISSTRHDEAPPCFQ